MAKTDPAIYAALDLGTNNCRLLIAAEGSSKNGLPTPAFEVLDSFSRIVRLGEGVAESGKLSAAAMERTMAALQQCEKKLRKHNVVHTKFVATEACRRAKNAPDFLNRVEAETGMRIDIISGEEEARLAFLGCASLLTETAKRALVFDIGGGSTEVMWIHDEASNRRITDWLSVDSGVMNLADKFGGQSFADLTFPDMVTHMERRLRKFDNTNTISETMEEHAVQMLSTSGTVTTLAAIHLNLPRYERSKVDGITLKVEDLRAVTQKLLAMRPSERFHHPCIGPDRADYILSGSAIFEALTNVWPAEKITIADRGVREGIIVSLIQHHAQKA